MASDRADSHGAGRDEASSGEVRERGTIPVVVDASALAAMLFGEPDASYVADRLEGRALFAPTLLRYELVSIALKKIARRPLSHGSILAALTLFERLDIREVQVPPTELVEGARESGLPVQDFAYLWLARTLQAELVTLDERLRGSGPGPSGDSTH